jgi:hypothetical protein
MWCDVVMSIVELCDIRREERDTFVVMIGVAILKLVQRGRRREEQSDYRNRFAQLYNEFMTVNNETRKMGQSTNAPHQLSHSANPSQLFSSAV